MVVKLTSFFQNCLIALIDKNIKNKGKLAILYGDFNVINFLYETGLQPNEDVILYPDSTAVFSSLKLFNSYNRRKLVSTELQYRILGKISDDKSKVFLFGDSDSILKATKGKMMVNYPGIKIVGTHNGYEYDTEEVIKLINNSFADFLLVGLGVGRQEPWIIKNYLKINSKVIISVGGWFRFLSGEKQRAPLYFRKLYLEWFYRLLTEFPYVWKRYLIGVPKFYYRIVTGRIKLDIRNLDG